MKFESRLVKISPDTHTSLTEVKNHLEADKQRQVTYSETIDYLVNHWKTLGELALGARKAS